MENQNFQNQQQKYGFELLPPISKNTQSSNEWKTC